MGDSDYISGVIAVGCVRGRGSIPPRVDLPPLSENIPLRVQETRSERTYFLHNDNDFKKETRDSQTTEYNNNEDLSDKSKEGYRLHKKKSLTNPSISHRYGRDQEFDTQEQIRTNEFYSKENRKNMKHSHDYRNPENDIKNDISSNNTGRKRILHQNENYENYSNFLQLQKDFENSYHRKYTDDELEQIRSLQELLRTVRSADWSTNDQYSFTEFNEDDFQYSGNY